MSTYAALVKCLERRRRTRRCGDDRTKFRKPVLVRRLEWLYKECSNSVTGITVKTTKKMK